MARGVTNKLSGTVIARAKMRPAVHKISDSIPREGYIDVTVDVGNGVSIVASVSVSGIPFEQPPPRVGDRVELEIRASHVLVRKESGVASQTEAPRAPRSPKKSSSRG